jgi:ADP-heptose:LPS heptosyltransferase
MKLAADRIAVVRVRPGLAPLLCGVPALRALRDACPHAHITLIGPGGADWFVERFASYVDELLPCPGFPGMGDVPFDARRTVAFLQEMHERELDLAIQLHGSGAAINAFTALLGARHTAGAVSAGQTPPDPECFIPYPVSEPEPARGLQLVAHIGARNPRGPELEFPLDGAPTPFGLEPRSYACVHLDGRFAEVADALAEHGLEVRDLSGDGAPLPTLAALLRDAAIVVSADTDVSHLATAVGAPTVAVFAPGTDVLRWTPVGDGHVQAVGHDVGEVLDAVRQLRAEPAPLA